MAIDRDSPTWRAVKAKVEAALESERNMLEHPAGAEQTALARGRIAAYRDVLALADTPPPIVNSTKLY